MDANRKRAYAYLLHEIMLEIRACSGCYWYYRWNPFKWHYWRQGLERCNRLADAFHNLPSYLSMEDFREDLFWSQLEASYNWFNWSKRDYRAVFEKKLSELEKESHAVGSASDRTT